MSPSMSPSKIALGLSVLFTSVGCGSGAAPPALRLGDGRVIESPELSLGREVYRRNCYACHGLEGDGQGPAATTMRPPPRNFQHGLFKFGGVAAGSLPTDAALERTLLRGLNGTPMLAWDLSDRERRAVVQYLKTFKPRGSAKSRWEEEPPGSPIEPTPDPWAGREQAAIARGAALYHVQGVGHAGCAGCHAGYLPHAEVDALTRAVTGQPVPGFRPDYYRTSLRETQYAVRLDDAGELLQSHQILVPDFWVQAMKTALPIGATISDGRGGRIGYTPAMQREDLYRTIAAGIGGAAMPTWKGALPEESLWALAYYVQSLIEQRGSPAAVAARRGLDRQSSWRP